MDVTPGPQRFSVSHLDERDFKVGGLRDYSAYRDLGIAEATGGLAEAHVIRMIAPFRPDLSVRHHHNVQFQLVYCLKGWFQTEFEGVGVHRLEAGSCWLASDTLSSAGRTTASCSKLPFPRSTRQSTIRFRRERT
jgi:hypothetical protein